MKKKNSETDGLLKNIFYDKDHTYELLEYNMRADLEKLINKYADIFAQLHIEAKAGQEDYLYEDYALNSGTLPIQAMARIAYFFNTYVPLHVEAGPSYEQLFLREMVDELNPHSQLNGDDIWKYLVELGGTLDKARTLIGFLDNDISCAYEAKEERRKGKNEPR